MSKKDRLFYEQERNKNFDLLGDGGRSGGPLIFGHRGARGESPENTIAGFLRARDAGVDGIETDIAVTADFVPVMHHDAELADGRLIRDLPASECFGIPTLAESLQALPEMTWLLEIKTYPPHPEKTHPPALMVARVLKVLEAAEADMSRIAIKAFDWEVLREVAKQRPALRPVVGRGARRGYAASGGGDRGVCVVGFSPDADARKSEAGQVSGVKTVGLDGE
jgi:glycerophosphoryl diester phosphodiesterase